jgi:hypothetical protein
MIFETYKKRKDKANNTSPDVYRYDTIPLKLSRQVILLVEECIGEEKYPYQDDNPYKIILDIYLREIGEFSLLDVIEMKSKYANPSSWVQMQLYLLNVKEIDGWLSLTELIFRYIENVIRIDALKTIDELNYRFKEHCVGYEYTNGIIVRIDSKEIHKEVVKPALVFLASDSIYDAVNVNYRQAFEHYRLQKYDECLVNSSKAFEGCMKAICIKRGWSFDDKKDSASKLISICASHQLFPEYLTEQLTHLRCLMETVVTPRNRVGAHVSTTYTATPKEIASYVLHFSASTIVFLIECEKVLE